MESNPDLKLWLSCRSKIGESLLIVWAARCRARGPYLVGNSGFVVGRTAPTGDDVLAAIRRGVTQSRERLWKRWKTKNVSHFPPARASAAMIHLVAPSIQSIWVYPLQSRKNHLVRRQLAFVTRSLSRCSASRKAAVESGIRSARIRSIGGPMADSTSSIDRRLFSKPKAAK